MNSEKEYGCENHTSNSNNVKELVSKLEDIPVHRDMGENIIACEDFVEKHLYKYSEVIADVIIFEEMRRRFGLQATFLKSLKSTYKKQNKAYTQMSTRGQTSDAELLLPKWYEHYDKGIRFFPGILADDLAATEKVICCKDKYYAYKNGVYISIDEKEVRAIIRSRLLPRETKMRDIIDAEGQWQLLINKKVGDLNPDAYILNLKNGLYNVRTGELKPHTHEFLSTIRLDVNYDSEADCPVFKKYLNDAMQGNIEQISLIQEILGYCLIPVTVAQKCFVLVGQGGAGKSVLLNVLNEILLGKDNVSNVSWQSLNERFKPALLFGKLANIFSDLPTKNIDDNGIFKALVGEDSIAIENKHKDGFSFKNYARLVFSCNSMPRNYGDRSEGFYRRLIIIRFEKSVPPDMRDPYLIDKLRLEADGIFLFALKGLRRLIDNKFVFSETDLNRAELQRYREESDSVLSFFNDCCIIKEGSYEPSTYLYEQYQHYCKESGLMPYSQKKFVQTLLEAHPEITRGTDTYGKQRILKSVHFNATL